MQHFQHFNEQLAMGRQGKGRHRLINRAPKRNREKIAVIVLGSPRSGTSAISAVVSELGFSFGDPERFLDPKHHRHNPIFFELKALNDLNDQMIEDYGHRYVDFDFFPKQYRFDDDSIVRYESRIEDFISQEFGASRKIGLKDPRFCFTLPIWEHCLHRLGFDVLYVWVIREFGSCVKSNQLVNGWSTERNFRVVFWSNLFAADHLGKKPAFVANFDAFIASPLIETKRLAAWLGESVRSAVTASKTIHAKNRHQRSGDFRLPPYLRWASDKLQRGKLTAANRHRIWEFLRDTGIEALLRENREQIDVLNQQYQSAQSSVTEIQQLLETRSDELRSVHEENQKLIALFDANQTVVKEMSGERDRIKTELGAREVDIVQLHYQLEAAKRQLSDKCNQFDALQSGVATLGSELDESKQHLTRLEQELKVSNTELAQARSSLDSTRRQLEDACNELSRTKRNAQDNLRELDQLRSTNSSLTQIASERESRLLQKNQELDYLRESELARRSELDGLIAQKEAQLQTAMRTIAGLSESLVSDTNVRARQEWEIARLKEQVASAQELADRRTIEWQQLASSLTLIQSEKEKLDLALAQRVNELSGAEKNLEVFRSELSGTKLELEQEREAVSKLKDAVIARDARLNDLVLERSTFGAQVGRWLTRMRGRIAPTDSYIGQFISSLILAIRLVRRDGVRAVLFDRSRLIRQRLVGVMTDLYGARTDRASVSAAVPEEFSYWIATSELEFRDLRRQVRRSKKFGYQPLISILLPVYKVPSSIFDRTIESIRAQTYANWETCIAFADLENAEMLSRIERYSAQDSRIKVKVLSENGGISRNSNSCLALATGEFVALLDHDDELAPNALFEMVATLNKDPTLDFLYSDKDCINENSTLRQHALFKPDWSPEILFSVNYLTHLNVIRKTIIDEIGGFRSETDGAQDWDIFLRVTERTSKIARVPGVLYHWRIIAGSTSTGIGAKPYALGGQLRALEDHVARRGLAAHVLPDDDSGFRVRWKIPKETAVDMIIHLDRDDAALDHLIGQLAGDSVVSRIRWWVVCPQEITVAIQNKLRDVHGGRGIVVSVIGFPGDRKTAAVAEAIAAGTAPVLLLLSAEVVEVTKGTIDELVGWCVCHPEIGFASGLILDQGQHVVEAGLVVDQCKRGSPMFRGEELRRWGWFGGPLWYRNCSAASPWALAISRQEYEQIGGILRDEDFLSAVTDLCLRIRGHGKRGLVDPHARVFLHHAPLNGVPPFDESLAQDPHFHPAFSSVVPLRLRGQLDFPAK